VHVNAVPLPSSHPSTNPFSAATLWVHKTSPYEYLMYNSCNANSTLFYFPLPSPLFCQVLRKTVERRKALHALFPLRRDLSVQIHKGADIDCMHSLALFELFGS